MVAIKRNWIWLFVLAIVAGSFISCGEDDEEDDSEINGSYKQHMRDFVQGISAYAKLSNANFIVIPQNGPELVTTDGNEDGSADLTYLNAIDGVGREDLFYGYDDDNAPTPKSESDYMISFLDICEANNVEVLTTDYCWDNDKMDDSYVQNETKNYVSFAAPERDLNLIPDYPATVFNENSNDVESLARAKNYLYLLDPSQFSTKQAFISAINATNYDAIIIDLFFEDGTEFAAAEIDQLKTKQNGGKRIVIAYMSIGEAEDYRYYWESSWSVGSPEWIKEENPDWEGNYKVNYWDAGWQQIIYGNENSYLKKILNANFDGVYLDIIDAFEYFE